MISDNARSGMQQAPARSLFNALGFTAEELKKPMVGIVSSYNEIVPGHMNIDKIVNAVKLGVAEAGGVPVVFPAIAVCDGIAMGHVGMKYSLVTRDLIADSTECMAIAHQFDALVMVPNCDKNVPGLLMAAARLNLPTVFVSGGPMLAGHVQGKKRSLSSMFEAVGSYAAGTMTEDDVLEYENKVCPTCGSCSGMYTANSMNCLTEALGMGLRGNGTIPAVYSERIRLAKHAGMQIVELIKKDIRPRDIMTEKAFINALTMDMALGCSTNSMLHLPAIAHEAGVELNLEIANEISKKTPNLCHLAPAGDTFMEDLNEAGGIYAVMNEINKLGLLSTDLLTVTGKTVAENCARAGADWMTVICSATIPTMVAAKKEVKDLQVELYGDWTYEHAKAWKEIGLQQVVYHQSRDALLAGETWGEKDLEKIKKLVEMGFKVSVTGGLEKESLSLFKGIAVHAFIAGRGIRDAKDPAKAAREFKEEIAKYW